MIEIVGNAYILVALPSGLKKRITPATIKPSTEKRRRSPLLFAIATMVERASGVTNHTGSIKRKKERPVFVA